MLWYDHLHVYMIYFLLSIMDL